MPTSITLKNIPDIIAQRLRRRAVANRRSVQAELRLILEDALLPKRRSLEEVVKAIRALDFRTPSETVAMLREDRRGR